ncbi:MAG: gliding motility-associated C-terminal domain-containing protein [Flavobacteriales bacterium]
MQTKTATLTLFIFLLSALVGFAQQNPCVKIESILVAACTSTGSPEGSNEMMRFRIGDTDLNTANMFITWGSGQYGWSGVVQNQNTANIVAAFNNTIQSCGFIKEPVNGLLPANSQVIIITGTSTSTTANSFAALSDTIYMIFHNATNQGGHFLNFSTNPPVNGTIQQTTTISFNNIPGCTSSATYFRDQLIMQNGMIGNEPGSTVLFDANMNPTYINNGCIASIDFISASWNSPGVLCQTADPIDLNTLVTGTPSGFWTGQGVSSAGIFSPAGLSGQIAITYNVLNEACGDTTTQTNIINVIEFPSADFNLPETICEDGQPLNLADLVTGTSGGTFTGPSIFQSTFNPAGNNGTVQITYTVGSGDCQTSSTQTIDVIVLPTPILSATEGNYCPGDEVQAVEITNAGNASGVWFGTPDLQVPIAQGNSFTPAGTQNDDFYVILSLAGCNSEPTTYIYNYYPIETILTADLPDEIEAPFNLEAFNESVNAASCQWFLNGEPIQDVNGNALSLLLEQTGDYVLKLVCQNDKECTDQDSITFTIIDKTVVLEIPNVFTPNGDNVNDLFTFNAQGIKQLAGRIFNRWGKIVYEWEGLQAYWDGKINDKEAPAGAYFYVVDTTDIFDVNKQIKGTVTLVR